MDNPIQKSTLTIVGLTVGVIMVCALLIPVAVDQMDILTDSGFSTWATLIGVVVIIAIIGLVVVAIDGFMSRGKN
jgi:hypothetical protein